MAPNRSTEKSAPINLSSEARQRAPITLTPFGAVGASSDDVVVMVVEASFDPSICEQNYVPPRMKRDQARACCAEREGVVMRLDGKPIGVALFHPHPDPGEGVEIPPGYVEFEIWMLPACRGHGVFMRAFHLVIAAAAPRFEGLIGVTWENNQTTMALFRNLQWKRAGRSFWKRDGCSGHCEVHLYDLAPARLQHAA